MDQNLRKLAETGMLLRYLLQDYSGYFKDKKTTYLNDEKYGLKISQQLLFFKFC